MEIEFKEIIRQELRDITNQLKKIPSIASNYMEYMAAIIYAIYQNKEEFKKILHEQEHKYVSKALDERLEKIRKDERSSKLFANIQFQEVIEDDEVVSFGRTLLQLEKMIENIEKIEKNSKPILAEALEYIIMKAAQERKISSENGEIYTPKGVVKTLVKLLDIQAKQVVYNPACGSGNFIVESAKSAEIYAFGETDSLSNYNICMTNLWLHDMYNKRIKQDRREEFPPFDIVIGNPPFAEEKEEGSKNIELYYRYDISKTASSYVKYLVKMINSLNEQGRMAVILPHGFLFKKTKSEYLLRREWIEKNYIDAIISLPEKLFYNTKIPVIILVVNKVKKTRDILFIDASQEYTSKRKTNILTVQNQDKIANTYHTYEEIQNYSKKVTLEEIKKNDYDLTIKQYIRRKSEVETINQEEIEKRVHELEEERYIVQRKIEKLIANVKDEE